MLPFWESSGAGKLGDREGVAVGILEVGDLGVVLKSCDTILGGLQPRLVEIRSEREWTDGGVQVAFGECDEEPRDERDTESQHGNERERDDPEWRDPPTAVLGSRNAIDHTHYEGRQQQPVPPCLRVG